MDRVDYQSLIVQDVINLENKGELNLSPWYQRRSVWIRAQQAYLINTLLESKPIPALYIRHTLDLENEKSIKEIVDGQQRTRAILAYCKNEFKARHPAYSKLMLFSQLKRQEREKFLLTALPVGYLLGASDADVIDIFARINSVAKTLNPQEKRNALFSGEFKQFCVSQSVDRTEFWREYGIFSGNDIARMTEVQFISDLVVNMLDGLSDFGAPKLNKYYQDFDEDFPRGDEIRERLDRVFDFLISLEPEVISDTIFQRQPIFFSLFLVLDQSASLSKKKIERGLVEIDNRFNSDLPLSERPKEDANFYLAASSTTQRIAQRKVRDKYIKRFVG